MLATSVTRLPRFIIFPYACVSFVVAGIFVQMKSSSTQWVPVRISLYFERHLILEIYSSHTCNKLEFLSPKSLQVSASKKSNGECDIPNFRYLSWSLYSRFVVLEQYADVVGHYHHHSCLHPHLLTEW